MTCIASLLAASESYAIPIDFPPLTGGNTIAANDTVNGNIWTGEAQSFTALDPNVLFGFYMFEQSQIPSSLLFSLYAGDGIFTNLLSQQSTVLSTGTIANPSLVTVDFASVNLVVGAKYTVAVTLPSQGLPPTGTYSNASVMYAGSSGSGNPNPYTDGSFYYVGSSYNPAFFLNRDIAFKVTPVPEPSTYALLGSGVGLLAFLRSRKKNIRSGATSEEKRLPLLGKSTT